MYEFECLTIEEELPDDIETMCRPFSGACYPEATGHCGPECYPV